MVDHYMKRRNFLKYLTMLGLGPPMSRFLLSCAEPPIKTEAAHPATIPLAIFDAHAHSLTLKDIAAISSRPIMDSHTSPAPVGNPSESTEKAIRRMRSWKEGVSMDPYVSF